MDKYEGTIATLCSLVNAIENQGDAPFTGEQRTALLRAIHRMILSLEMSFDEAMDISDDLDNSGLNTSMRGMDVLVDMMEGLDITDEEQQALIDAAAFKNKAKAALDSFFERHTDEELRAMISRYEADGSDYGPDVLEFAKLKREQATPPPKLRGGA